MSARIRAALQLLALGALGTTALVFPAHTIIPSVVVQDGSEITTDAVTFSAVVDRLRAGEGYYGAMGDELRRRDYPTRDAFNWRTPLHLTALAGAPWFVSRAVLTALLVVLFASTMAIAGKSSEVAWTAGVLQMGVLVLQAAADAPYISEVWAGALLGLSACGYVLRRDAGAIVLALAALFIRELAAPYCLACTLIAVYQRRWQQCVAWLAGATAYFVYYGWHVLQVRANQLPTDFSHPAGWLEFGGLPFLQSTIHKLGWLAFLPGPFSSLVLLMIVAGVISSRTPLHLRAGSATYAAFFLVFGKPFNDYWGWLAVPIWAITCGYGAEWFVRSMNTVQTGAAVAEEAP